jgi:hypothetical protein
MTQEYSKECDRKCLPKQFRIFQSSLKSVEIFEDNIQDDLFYFFSQHNLTKFLSTFTIE